MYAPVAQWIEHLTTDQKVRGSSPFGRTRSLRTWAAETQFGPFSLSGLCGGWVAGGWYMGVITFRDGTGCGGCLTCGSASWPRAVFPKVFLFRRALRAGSSPLFFDAFAGVPCCGQHQRRCRVRAAALAVGQDAGVGVGSDHDAGVPEQILSVFRSAPASWAREAAPCRRSWSRTGCSPARVVSLRNRVVA
jgi:hypothetical protein